MTSTAFSLPRCCQESASLECMFKGERNTRPGTVHDETVIRTTIRLRRSVLLSDVFHPSGA
jgi:hypothetical protein